ncbi:glycoside hydrolase family 16 protein [Pseudopedobacter beijingensis]|uniref:Family 16 glycosylhydrolase n=1 Tax=Pseudopedobacter beijingensis TaxID=1207056 RepID=A0ABW4IEH4_9SPHI
MKSINQYISLLLLSIVLVSCSSKDKPNKEESDITLEELGSGETNNYKLVWEDLFNGETLDENTWNIEVNGDGGGNQELQFYREENVSVGKDPNSGRSCLILTAKKEQFSGKNATSGRINSQKKKFFKYGKIEASIKLPKTANGLWPAFWMMGNDYSTVGWPACGETDILEMGHSKGIANKTQDRFFNGALHWGKWSPTGSNPMYAKDFTSSYGLQEDFHLYTLIWDETAIKMYLDLDKNPDVAPYFQMSIASTEDDNSPGHYFHKEFFILFNLAVGGHFPGISNINQVTALSSGDAKMYVDYVKVYQKAD